MNSFKKNIPILILSLLFLSCNKFESRFYNKIDIAQKMAIESDKPVKFNLDEITDFEWIKMLHISGNESVPIYNFEIEPVLKHKTTDLGTFEDRFYFLNAENELIVKEIDYQHSPSYSIEFCPKDSTDKKNYYRWLSKEECIFTLIPNTKIVGTGTVFLFPKCETKFDKNNFGIFYKEK